MRYFPSYGYIGIGIVAFVEVALALKLRPWTVWTTPLAWTGYILFVDALNRRTKGRSLIVDRTGEFLVMLPLSVGFWEIFEGYNLFIKNWHYIGLPERIWVRYAGYAWSFATITPAIFETAELVAGWGPFRRPRRGIRVTRGLLWGFMAAGATFLVLPLVSPFCYARYMAALVWCGFAFLLDPVNYLRGRESILRDWEEGRYCRFASLLLAGLICGVLWEFWNYWAPTKWVYDVPILGHIKLFEMPVLGFLGFPPFAVELFAMYNFVRRFPIKALQER
ncbi:MAG: hypothetical protein DRQ14_08000 [Candidatus Latescibacterota bacterium]|nr:MAG: hypothetical protein DRQ14_08000 [Candidatus Latescibacterota bacterium]